MLGEGASARALPVIHIVAPEGNYDFQNKYYTDVTEYRVPCDLPPGRQPQSRPRGCPGAADQGRAAKPVLGRREQRGAVEPPLKAS